MYYVYVLQSTKTAEFYKGLTNDLERRLSEHTFGMSHTTKFRRPFKLIHVEICKTRKEARKLEIFFKSGFGREIIKEFTKEYI